MCWLGCARSLHVYRVVRKAPHLLALSRRSSRVAAREPVAIVAGHEFVDQRALADARRPHDDQCAGLMLLLSALGLCFLGALRVPHRDWQVEAFTARCNDLREKSYAIPADALRLAMCTHRQCRCASSSGALQFDWRTTTLPLKPDYRAVDTLTGKLPGTGYTYALETADSQSTSPSLLSLTSQLQTSSPAAPASMSPAPSAAAAFGWRRLARCCAAC